MAEVGWPGRRTQGATDPFNSALNYGYGILYSQVERALVLAGLDPYAGFVHIDRPGKVALVYDAVEEFRQTVVDRTVMAVFNRGTEIELDERGRMTEASRRDLAAKVLARLEAVEKYDDKRHPLRAVIQMVERRLAAFLRRAAANLRTVRSELVSAMNCLLIYDIPDDGLRTKIATSPGLRG
ncbi:MAG: CRISPR-associated endonuclease Cas1 [Caldilineaceae bacterium]